MIIPVFALLSLCVASIYLLYSKIKFNIAPLLFAILVTSAFNLLVPLDLLFGLYIRDPYYFDHLQNNQESILTASLFAAQSFVLFALTILAYYSLPFRFINSKIELRPTLAISGLLSFARKIPPIDKQRTIAIFTILLTLIVIGSDYLLISDSIDQGLSYKHSRIIAREGNSLILFLAYAYNITLTFTFITLLFSKRCLSWISISSFVSILSLSFY